MATAVAHADMSHSVFAASRERQAAKLLLALNKHENPRTLDVEAPVCVVHLRPADVAVLCGHHVDADASSSRAGDVAVFNVHASHLVDLQATQQSNTVRS